MYYTLTQRLSALSGSMTLFPGHAYGGAHAPLEQVRAQNAYLQFQDLASWRRAHGLRG
jgi:hypothetical protein